MGVLAGTEFLGDHEWYTAGARYLLSHQFADGSWLSAKSPPTADDEGRKRYLDTCYAILFLRRATLSLTGMVPPRPVAMVEKPRPSTLAVRYPGKGLPPVLVPAMELVLDCSGSMKDPVEGEPKYLVARRIMLQAVDELPADFQVGLRVFGHMGFWGNNPGQPADGIVVLYNRLRQDPGLNLYPRTFFFAGKAAPAYRLAKVIIKFINNLAATIDGDPTIRERLKVVFLPDYCVSLAEHLIPASDVSNQISTAGYEASGTSNMKFMMNGALTIGTRDGATIEMAAEAGEENFFLFGLTAEQVTGSRGWYNQHWHCANEPETRKALDLIFSDYFSRYEPGVFAPLRDMLLTHDHYMHLADLKSYLEADERLRALYADPDEWARKAILNVAGSGKFSSDRTIAEYAAEIWNVQPCPVPEKA